MFNNPISFKDPTGLAPEKEQGGGNKLQEALTMETSYQEYWMELIRQLEMQQARYLERMLGYDAEKMNEFLSKIPVGGGGSTSGNRTGTDESDNGAVGVNVNANNSNGNKNEKEQKSFMKKIVDGLSNFIGIGDSDMSEEEKNAPHYYMKTIEVWDDKPKETSEIGVTPEKMTMITDWMNSSGTEIYKNIGNFDSGIISISKGFGYGLFSLNLANEFIQSIYYNQSDLLTGMNIGVNTTCIILGGWEGIILGVAYEGIKYEYFDSRIPYSKFYTGNVGLFPADNTKIGIMLKGGK